MIEQGEYVHFCITKIIIRKMYKGIKIVYRNKNMLEINPVKCCECKVLMIEKKNYIMRCNICKSTNWIDEYVTDERVE